MWLYKTLLLEKPPLVNPGQSVTQTLGDWAMDPKVPWWWPMGEFMLALC